jgi:hypothetical protein
MQQKIGAARRKRVAPALRTLPYMKPSSVLGPSALALLVSTLFACSGGDPSAGATSGDQAASTAKNAGDVSWLDAVARDEGRLDAWTMSQSDDVGECDYNVWQPKDSGATADINEDGVAKFELPDLKPFRNVTIRVLGQFIPYACVTGAHYQNCQKATPEDGADGTKYVVDFDLLPDDLRQGPQVLLVTAQDTFANGEIKKQGSAGYKIYASYSTALAEGYDCSSSPYQP